ncbi:MAG: hypothetical protein M1813_009688 [Trichoglossum hirsutum]|nr:MAG: hypothetical protein M1813_009688 [Trichoglossum hirsutum]
MASQRPGENVIRQDVVVEATLAGPSGETTSPSGSRDDVRSYQGVTTVDEKLYSAIITLEDARGTVYKNYTVWLEKFAALERAFVDRTEEFNALYTQHEMATANLRNMATENFSLHRDLKGSQETIRTYEQDVAKSKQIEALVIQREAMARQQLEAMVRQREAMVKTLQDRVRELEGEKENKKQEHENALRNAADRVIACQQRIEELEVKSETQESSDRIPSPSEKRQRPEEDIGRAAKKNRRRNRQAATTVAVN